MIFHFLFANMQILGQEEIAISYEVSYYNFEESKQNFLHRS